VRDILIDAYENARFLSEQHFCVSPALNIECFNSENPDEEIHAPLVPLHLYYIVFELLKVLCLRANSAKREQKGNIVYFQNSMRATIEHFHRSKGTFPDSSEELPPVKVQLVLGPVNLSIKVNIFERK
jgi:hypothetical protein